MINSVHKVKITGYSSKGEGVARLDDGRVVFVKCAVKDELCEIRITKELKRSCHAEIVRIIHESEHRIEPDCDAYSECGGCNYRHMSYDEELRAKLQRVNDALEFIAGAKVRVNEIHTTGSTDGYRNKATLHTDSKNGEIEIGFYREGTHEVCAIKKCLLLKDELNNVLNELYDKPTILGSKITLRVGSSGDVHTQIAGEKPADKYIIEKLDGITYAMSVTSFFQVNTDAALILYKMAREYAGLQKNETLIDLYCGVGALTLFVGRDAGYVLGVESNETAVKNAVQNAQFNDFEHIDFVCDDVSNLDIGDIKPDCIIVDPPRRGLSEKIKKSILEARPSRIVYISCDPATMARDIKDLSLYEVSKICAVDMFPRTANVECCALLVVR